MGWFSTFSSTVCLMKRSCVFNVPSLCQPECWWWHSERTVAACSFTLAGRQPGTHTDTYESSRSIHATVTRKITPRRWQWCLLFPGNHDWTVSLRPGCVQTERRWWAQASLHRPQRHQQVHTGLFTSHLHSCCYCGINVRGTCGCEPCPVQICAIHL